MDRGLRTRSSGQGNRDLGKSMLEGERVAGSPPLDQVVDEARELVVDGMRKREAARAVAERHGIPANDVYRVLVTDTYAGMRQ